MENKSRNIDEKGRGKSPCLIFCLAAQYIFGKYTIASRWIDGAQGSPYLAGFPPEMTGLFAGLRKNRINRSGREKGIVFAAKERTTAGSPAKILRLGKDHFPNARGCVKLYMQSTLLPKEKAQQGKKGDLPEKTGFAFLQAVAVPRPSSSVRERRKCRAKPFAASSQRIRAKTGKPTGSKGSSEKIGRIAADGPLLG